MAALVTNDEVATQQEEAGRLSPLAYRRAKSTQMISLSFRT